MRFWRKRIPVWDQGEDIYDGKSFKLRNAPKDAEYRVVDRYGQMCLQSSRDGKLSKFVEIYKPPPEPYFCPIEWEILGVAESLSEKALVNMAKKLRGEQDFRVLASIGAK